jgi:hypothetical protein
VRALNSLRSAVSGLTTLGLIAAIRIPASPPSSITIPSAGPGWPDPAFLPERQCRGRYATEDLERLVPRAKLALWLPGTRSVAIDPTRHCITISVESIGAGRLAELVIRGVSVPRRAVFLRADRS